MVKLWANVRRVACAVDYHRDTISASRNAYTYSLVATGYSCFSFKIANENLIAEFKISF